jgi:phage gp45-like
MALSRITEAVASFTDLTIGDDLTLTDDLLLASDANIIKFGADADVTLTHVHNTGLLLNSTSVIQFNDASQNIGAPNATTLDINATDEIELNATLVDVNANLDVSGTYTGAGLMTTGGNIVIPDAGNIGSASDTDAIAISSGGVVTFSQNPVFPDGGISIADLDIDGATDIGAAIVDADLFIIDDGAGGTNRKVTASRIKTYIGASTAADDLTAGDAAVNLTTSSGNITIDAAANDSDIIFKGTDDSSDITMLTLDGSEAGAATFNNKIIATELDISGNIDIDGTSNLDVVDIDGAVDMASTLQVDGKITGSGDMLLNGTTPTLTIGDGGEEDTAIIFDGNAQDFYVGLDDSADDLVIGKGSVVGTTPAISIDENLLVTVSDDVFVTGRATGTTTTNTDGQMDLEVSNHFNYTPSGDDEIELDNFKGGQTGTIFLDNSGGHQISVDSTIVINADVLSALATAGKYMLSYYCTVDQPNATLSDSANNDKILMSATGALT